MSDVSSSSKSSGFGLKTGVILIVAAAGAAYYFFGGAGQVEDLGTTFVAQRGDLAITVLEGGNVEAMESQEIRSEIKGHQGVKILSIIEEGYQVTQKDIDNGLVLVELDSSGLEDQLINQQISLQTAEATFIEREAQFDIVLNQNQSDLSAAELNVKFARMDFEKFLGANQVQSILDDLKLLDRFKEEEKAPETAFEPKVMKGPDGFIRGDATQKAADAAVNRERPARVGRPDDASRGGGERSWSQGRTGGGRPGGERAGGGSQGGGGRGGFPGGSQGGSPEQMQQMRQMIEANGGQFPDFMKERMEQMGVTVEDFLKRLDSTEGGGGRPAPTEPPKAEVAPPTQVTMVLDEDYVRKRAALDFSVFADADKLEDGEAKQMLRSFDDSILVAEEEHRLAKNRLDGQVRLFEKEFITKNELELEQVNVQKREIQKESALIDKMLYIQYTFPKTAEQLLSDFEESLMNLSRTRKEAGAKISQEDARLKSAEQKFNIENWKTNDLEDQISKCVIRAETLGLVVYGSSTDSNPFRRSSSEPIQEGTTLRQRQLILTIPDMTRMSVKVDIHEASVKQVAIGQTATFHFDSFPDNELTGSVHKVAVLADSANAFMNPDLKVYPTVVSIDGVHEWLRPGMSAEVEILIDTVEDAVFIPIQAVSYSGNSQVCYVMKNGTRERREVVTGSFTEEFIQIKEGLSEAEEVLLLAPIEADDGSGEDSGKESAEPAPAESAA
jgi:uncharacterized membrane protein YgcG